MRGEINTFCFEEQYREARSGTNDRSVNSLSYRLWLYHDDFVDHPISVSETAWRHCARVLAFLRTDLEVTRNIHRFWDIRQLLALLGLLVLAVACLAGSFVGTLQPFWIAWALVGVTSFCYALLDEPGPPAEFVERTRYAPFRTEAEWLACQPLVADFHIPEYDAMIHEQPVHSPAAERLMALWGIPWFVIWLLVFPLVLAVGLRRRSCREYMICSEDPEPSLMLSRSPG